MARIYANENFPRQAVERLRELGHDVLTTHEAGNSNAGIPDDEVLRFALREARVVVTLNRRDFIQLHGGGAPHAGIVVCSVDRDYSALAGRVDTALRGRSSMAGELLRVERGNAPSTRSARAPQVAP